MFSLPVSLSPQIYPQQWSSPPQGAISSLVCNVFTSLHLCLLPTRRLPSFLMLAGCNSNSMWKLCLFHWKCCYLQRAIKHNTEAPLLWSAHFFIFLCRIAKIVYFDWWRTMMGHKVMTYELTASKFECLPVSSVGHCRVRPAAQTRF